jgi:hypothetical protein
MVVLADTERRAMILLEILSQPVRVVKIDAASLGKSG